MVKLYFKDLDFKELDYLFFRTKNEKKYASYSDLFSTGISDLIQELHLKANFIKRSFNQICLVLQDMPNFINRLLENYKKDLRIVLQKPSNKGPFIIGFENKPLLLYTEIFFFEIKSFLDIFARTISKLFQIGELHTFGTKNKKDAGGKFIETLRSNAKKEFKNPIDQIIKIIRKYKSIWIDDAVYYRTTVTHHKTLQTKIISTSPILVPPLKEDVKIEIIFDGKPFGEYINKIMKGFDCFLEEIINLLKKDFEYK